MKAILQTKYGPPDVLKLEEVPKPVPGDNEVLVKVHASSVNFGNLALVGGKPFLSRFWSGLMKPKDNIPGSDLAGRIEAVGSNVKEFKPGDEIFGDIFHCGSGAYAEYVSAPEDALALKPNNISFEEAAAVPQAALVALQALRDKGKIRAGHRVLITGASGGNGTFAVQIAKSYGAEVIGVCSARNLDMVRAIGADKLIDYTKEDFAASGEGYDLILVNAGYRSIFAYRRILNPGGVYISSVASNAQIFQSMFLGPPLSWIGNRKLTYLYHKPSRKDLIFMKELIETGKVKPVIDKVFPLSEAAEAFRYYGEGHSRGKVIISI